MPNDNETVQMLADLKKSQQEALDAMQRVEELASLALPLIQLQTFRLTALLGVLAADGARGATLIAKYNAALAKQTPRELLEADSAFTRAMNGAKPN